MKTDAPSSDQISQLHLIRFCSSFPNSTTLFPPVLNHFCKMLFSSRILWLAAPLSTIFCCALVSATPRQTPAPVKARQASNDTAQPDIDQDPNDPIDGTTSLRNGMIGIPGHSE